ncbi:MFS transporter [Dietzia lutea]|uniref:Major facilitator superfamily (MFS) profile domain-containing protein n=1 Tax=Dietzia lutea TaxID=546160 RepID=A0A2S1R4U2_9ACTN|nr:MFS transporter [Dietzia lutea]AWH91281.1 hypothetical protein A6035_02860 [Dietzia lutea]
MTPLVRLFIAAVLINGAYDAVRVAVSYRVLALGGDATTVGIVAGTFALLPMLLALHFGRLVDRSGSRGVFFTGIALSALAVSGAALSPSIWVLAVSNTVLGLGQIMTMIGAQGFVMELTERSRHVNGFAAFTLAVSLGQSVGTPAIGLLLGGGGTAGPVKTTFPLFVMAAVIVIALPFALSLPRRAPGGGVARPEGGASMIALLRRPGMIPAIYAALVVITGVDLVTAYMPVIGESVGLSPMVVTLLVAVRSVFSMISRAALPWILRKWPQRTILTLTPLVTVPAAVTLGLGEQTVVLGVALAVIGFFWGLNQPVTMNWVTAVAPAGDRSAALSLRLTGNRAAQVVIPLGAGAVAAVAGPGSVFLLLGGVSAISAVSTSVSLRRTPIAELETAAPPSAGERSGDPLATEQTCPTTSRTRSDTQKTTGS